MSSPITPFSLSVPQHALDDLNRRLDATRWPEKETVGDWTQGTPLAKVEALCSYWRSTYEWRRCERRLNQLGQFTTEIDGLDIHFLHVRSRHAHARPLLLTHGWPGSIVEFFKVIEPLIAPEEHGGNTKDAFHIVAPSLPGFGFSGKPAVPGWGVKKIAEAWIVLMQRLNYERWFAQGGDWGSAVTAAIGAAAPPSCAAIHLSPPFVFPEPTELATADETELSALTALAHYQNVDSGYASIQSTRPQSIGYGLVDSPVALAAWIYEKLWTWTDNRDAPEGALSMDEVLDNIMLYWLSATGASAARIYWESFTAIELETVNIPTGASVFQREILRTSRRWAERKLKNIIYWNEVERGGHFAAWEQPDLFVREIRRCFADLP